MKQRLKNWIIPVLAHCLARLTSGSLRLTVENGEVVEQSRASDQAVIFAVWHGQLWFPTYHWRNRGYVGLASQSQDGEYITRTLDRLGWEVVRGSASRGGARSLIKLIRKLREGKTVAITPDGPTGPRRELKPGIIYLAQKTDSVIIPVGLSFSRKKVFSSWDKFELPLPFSRGSLVYGSPLAVTAKKLTTEAETKYQQELESRLEAAIERAERVLEA